MRANLQLYHKVFGELRHWLEGERVTRQRNLALLVVGLYLAQSVYLKRISAKIHIAAKQLSLVTRLRRFLRNEAVKVQAYYEPLLRQLLKAVAGKEVLLIIDTTRVGPWHRALTVALAYHGHALPLAWSVHRGIIGNVAVTAQVALLERIYQLLPLNTIVCLTGDAAFRSSDLLLWLRRHGWHYVLRQRQEVNIRLQDGDTWFPIADIPLQEGETKVVGWVWIAKTSPFGPTWLLLHWQKGEEDPWLLVSDHAHRRKVLRLYRKRCWIEAMYSDMKSRGFDLEKSRLRQPDRLERLILAVAIAYVWLVTLGSWVVKNGYRSLIDRPDRRDLSYFRLGCDWLNDRLRLASSFQFRFLPYYLESVR